MKATSLAVLACIFACSCDSTTADPGTDAGVDATVAPGADAGFDAAADASQEAGTDGGSTACNALSNVGTVIHQTNVATAAVTGSGGTITDGTYVLTAAVVYSGAGGASGPTGTTFQDTLAIDPTSHYRRVVSAVDGAGLDGTPLHQNGFFTVTGSSIQVTLTCPVGLQPFTSFDSDGTIVRLYAPAGGSNPAMMFEYTRQ